MYPQQTRPSAEGPKFNQTLAKDALSRDGEFQPQRLRGKRKRGFLRIVPNRQIESVENQPASKHPTMREVSYEVSKSCMDRVSSFVLLVISFPVMLVIAALIKLTSPGPVIFRQRRLTKSGKEFTMLKFRSMRVDAEAKVGAVWAQKDDPRVTAVGALLRVTRLDELPQLVNILRGEMSLIGPRPERPEMVLNLASEIPSFHRRLCVKAGLTGLAQVGNGYAACTEGHRKKLAWDRLYIQRRSLRLDLWILLHTVRVVFTRKGAR